MAINKTTIYESEADPGGDPNGVQFYSKDVAGTKQLFAQDSDDNVYQLTPSGGSSDVSAANVFTFRPFSGFTGPTVFDTFDDLYNALDAQRSANDDGGLYRIIVDDVDNGGVGSTVAMGSPSGNFTYDFRNVILSGVHQDQNVLVDLGDPGGEGDSMEIINALWIEGLTIRATGTVTPLVYAQDQTVTLTRTTILGGGGEYVMDFLNITGCVIHLNDESAIYRANGAGVPQNFPSGTAAIRVNGCTPTVHMNGPNCVVNGNAFITGGGGSLDVYVNSSSARFNFDQADVGGVNTAVMSTAAGYWTAGPSFPITDPNGNLTATRGTIITDEATGDTWQNTDGASTWATFGGGPGGFTPGSILFADSLGNITEDNPQLFWDDVNNWLGIGTNGPDAPLTVVGDAHFYAGTVTTFGGGSVHITGPGELRTDQIQHSTSPGGSTPIDIMVPISVRGGIAKFWGPTFISEGHIYLDPADSPNAPSLGFGWDTNSVQTGYINDKGYQAGITQFRNLEIRDGKSAIIAFFDGATHAVMLGGNTGLPPANSVRVAGGFEVLASSSENIYFGSNKETFWLGGVGVTSMGTNYNTNGTATLFINDVGYLGGITQFRDFQVNNGKGALVMSLTGSTKLATFGGEIDMATSLKKSGTKVVGAQGAAVADATGASLADTTAQLNALLARLRASTGHGLIAG